MNCFCRATTMGISSPSHTSSATAVSVRPASESDRLSFNAAVADFPTGDLLQTWEWGDLKAASGWRPIRLMVERGESVIGVVSLLKRTLPKVGRSILYAPRGPVIDLCDSDAAAALHEAIRSVAADHRAILVKVDPPVEASDAKSAKALERMGFRKVQAEGFGGTQPRCVMQLDLDKDPDVLLASFKEKWRYNIRLAERKGVEVDVDAPRKDLPAFYNLLKQTCVRDGFLVRSLGYFEEMWRLLAPIGAMRMAITRFEGEAVAGALMFYCGDRAWYTYGASSNSHRNVMPNHLMQWRLIRQAQDLGCKWYDFRGVSPKSGEGDKHLEGLNRFKEGFRPRFVEYIGEYDLVLSPSWYWAWNVARPRVQRFLRSRSGRSGPAVVQE